MVTYHSCKSAFISPILPIVTSLSLVPLNLQPSKIINIANLPHQLSILHILLANSFLPVSTQKQNY